VAERRGPGRHGGIAQGIFVRRHYVRPEQCPRLARNLGRRSWDDCGRERLCSPTDHSGPYYTFLDWAFRWLPGRAALLFGPRLPRAVFFGAAIRTVILGAAIRTVILDTAIRTVILDTAIRTVLLDAALRDAELSVVWRLPILTVLWRRLGEIRAVILGTSLLWWRFRWWGIPLFRGWL